MAENETMEGKDLAQEQLKEFNEQVLEEINKLGTLKTGESATILGGIEVTKSIGDSSILSLKGKNIAIINGKTIQYSLANYQEVKKALEEEGQTLEDLGLPDLEEAIAKIQENNEQEQEEGEIEQKEEEPTQEDDEGIVDEEKDDKKPDLEEKEAPKESEPQRDSSWIEIRSDREIDEMRTFEGAIKKEYPELGEINRCFISPDKNNSNSYKLYVQGKQGKIMEVPLEQTEGENPMHESVTTIQNDGTNANKKTPIQILKINNRNMIMIFNGGRTTTSVHIANRTDGDNYTSTEISSIDSQNKLNDPTEGVKDQVSSSYGQLSQGDEQERAYATIKNFEKQDVPEEVDPSKDGAGIEAQEMDDFPTAIFDALKDSLQKAFEEKNISVSKEAIEKMATSIIEGKKFEDAVIDGMRIEEQAGRIPPDSAERVGENISDSLTNDEPVEEPEREEDPRLRGKR